MKIHFIFRTLVVIFSIINIGCYSNWQNLDSFVAKISCGSTKEKVTELAKLDLIQHEWDQTHHVFSIYKNSDAIAVNFNKKGELLSIVVSKPQIKLFGLFRK